MSRRGSIREKTSADPGGLTTGKMAASTRRKVLKGEIIRIRRRLFGHRDQSCHSTCVPPSAGKVTVAEIKSPLASGPFVKPFRLELRTR